MAKKEHGETIRDQKEHMDEAGLSARANWYCLIRQEVTDFTETIYTYIPSKIR